MPSLRLVIVKNEHGGVSVDFPAWDKEAALMMLDYAKEWVLSKHYIGRPVDGPKRVELSVTVYADREPIVEAPMWNKDLALAMISDARDAVLLYGLDRQMQIGRAVDQIELESDVAQWHARKQ